MKKLVILIIILIIKNQLFAQFKPCEGVLNKSFLEWEIQYNDYKGNPWDIEAHVIFTHSSGKTIKSYMFFSGENNTWKFRFTGTQTGEWKMNTEGPGALGGNTGRAIIKDSKDKHYNGFIIPSGSKWRWDGTNTVFVPQLVMGGEPDAYWSGGTVNSSKINNIARRFLEENKFTGLHIQVAGRWFDINRENTMVNDGYIMGPQNPDPRTFEVIEEILLTLQEHDGMLHIWMWGADAWGYPDGGPAGIGGQDSETAKRIFRYIASRLGALPNWTMGYGWDLEEWTNPDQLASWKTYMEQYFGNWPHVIGGRAHHRGDPPSNAYWAGDYTGYTSFRPNYDTYVQSLEHNPEKPSFQEDRFRIRLKDQFFFKDYTPDMLVRGLWHSTLAGGVANIWGNLTVGPDDNFSGGFNDHGVMIKDQINTCHEFFFDKSRFIEGMMPANHLTDYQQGVEITRYGGGNLNVCLASDDNTKFIFYKENSKEVRMDLSNMNGKQKAIAVDTKKAYKEIYLGTLNAEEQIWAAPYPSNWAVAIGDF